MASKSNKITKYLNYTIEVQTTSGKTFEGKFLAFDKHMNIILSECVENRTIVNKKTKEERKIQRSIGLIILRGDCVLGYTPLLPPNKQKQPEISQMNSTLISSAPQMNPSLVGPPPGIGIGQPMHPSMMQQYPPMNVIPNGMHPHMPTPLPGVIPTPMAMYPPMMPPMGVPMMQPPMNNPMNQSMPPNDYHQ